MREQDAGLSNWADLGARVSGAVDVSLDGLVLIDASTGQPWDLAAVPGRWLAVLIRHRY